MLGGGYSESPGSLFNSLTGRKDTNKQALKVIWGLHAFSSSREKTICCWLERRGGVRLL